MAGELFEDVKAVDRLSKSLAVPGPSVAGEVAAAERGRRELPDGTIEDYERIEFREGK